MATLAADKPRVDELGEINEIPVIAADIIYEGAAVGDNGSGYARPLVAGDPFRGFAEKKVDNSGGAAGDKKVRVKDSGLIELPISGLAITDVGKDVYASDDDTFTLTAGSNSKIGTVYRWESSGVGIVAFNARPKTRFVAVTVTVNAAATSGSSAANDALKGGTILGIYSTGNQDQLVDNVVLNADGSITVTLAAAATANNTFNVVVLK